MLRNVVCSLKKMDEEWGREHGTTICHIWHGAFLMKQAYEQIVRRALSDEEREWNVSTYDCEETPIEVALEDAETLPFFGERKIVIVKQPYF